MELKLKFTRRDGTEEIVDDIVEAVVTYYECDADGHMLKYREETSRVAVKEELYEP